MRLYLLSFIATILFFSNSFANFCENKVEMKKIHIEASAVAMAQHCQNLGYDITQRQALIVFKTLAQKLSVDDYEDISQACNEVCKTTKTSGKKCRETLVAFLVYSKGLMYAKDGDKNCKTLNLVIESVKNEFY